ncbi:putative DNA modification/repair radical SAM protein [Bacillota bacterium LX-D]|nr:putative DNA modification/repair radical SAM protein [Bacillota bacterium LX-D]
MDLEKKIRILAEAARYDVSCSSSGSKRKNNDGLGNGHVSGICHSWAADGRCISLLKILLTNYCSFNCAYCVNRSTSDVPRAMFTPQELADLTINFYRRNYIEGLFLSSAIFHSPDRTMELLLQTVQKLRQEYHFHGYIHLKAIPGADGELIKKAGQLVDRMSVNIELPSNRSLKLLAPQKDKTTILKPMDYIKNQITESPKGFVPAGQTTQLIVGASPEHDLNILTLSENLYHKYNLKRVYYSAYVPVVEHRNLPSITKPPLLREHRLYQADWLLRFYGFQAKELLSSEHPDFAVEFDPKTNWALNNLQHFPLEINKAPYEMLLRVPGIGVRSAKRIIVARKMRALDVEALARLGVVLKRAKYFITCQGKYPGGITFQDDFIRSALLQGGKKNQRQSPYEQLTIFSRPQLSLPRDDGYSSYTGEL